MADKVTAYGYRERVGVSPVENPCSACVMVFSTKWDHGINMGHSADMYRSKQATKQTRLARGRRGSSSGAARTSPHGPEPPHTTPVWCGAGFGDALGRCICANWKHAVSSWRVRKRKRVSLTLPNYPSTPATRAPKPVYVAPQARLQWVTVVSNYGQDKRQGQSEPSRSASVVGAHIITTHFRACPLSSPSAEPCGASRVI